MRFQYITKYIAFLDNFFTLYVLLSIFTRATFNTISMLYCLVELEGVGSIEDLPCN